MPPKISKETPALDSESELQGLESSPDTASLAQPGGGGTGGARPELPGLPADDPTRAVIDYCDWNAVPRPANTPLLPGPFSLHLDPLQSALITAAAPIHAQREAEVLGQACSYLFDAVVHASETDRPLHAHLNVILQLLRARRSELYLRPQHPGHDHILQAVERRRRGIAPGIDLEEGIADLMTKWNETYITSNIKQAAQNAVRKTPAKDRGKGRKDKEGSSSNNNNNGQGSNNSGGGGRGRPGAGARDSTLT